MKINNKLLMAVFFIIVPVFLVLFLSLNKFNQKLIDQREAQEYKNTGDIIKQWFLLQDDKLGLIFSSINNDALFLHSILLYRDLGYKERLIDELSNSVKKNNLDLFVFVGRDGDQVSNSSYQLSEKEVSQLCTAGAPANIIIKPIEAYLKCFPVEYHHNPLGNLIIGHYLYPNFEKLLTTAMSNDVKIVLDSEVNLEKSALHRDENLYHTYLLQDFLPASTGYAELKKIHDSKAYSKENALPLFFASILCVFIFMIAALYVVFWYLVPRRLQRTNELVKNKLKEKALTLGPALSAKDEINEMYFVVNELFTKLDQYEAQKREEATAIKISETAAQVAHDIRSPLAALTAATQSMSELPEDKRIMIRSAVQRINDIANDLAYRGDAKPSSDVTTTPATEKASVQLLSSLIDSLVSEKRLQYRARLNVVIQSALMKSSYGLFAKIQTVQLKRVLSNLVNNAVEAIDNAGLVTVDLKTNADDDIEIVVNDTGRGIADDKIPQLMQKGVTDKKDGHGLGLYHAKQSIESWDGEINISSKLGSGTTVKITLPKQTEPDWFVPELKIYQGTKVLILDDDNSIHQIWKGRFDSLGAPAAFFSFSNGDALREWSKKNPNPGAMLILCDYEIIGSTESGLDVIKELNLADHTVLVTSRYEEKHVRDECKKLGIKLLPKNLAGFVPVHIKEIPADLEYVLIDDSRLNRQTWEIMARRNKKQLITFERAKDFYDVMDKVNKNIKLYVDYNLGYGENGGVVTKKISDKGFSKIYLATGDSTLDVKSMPWLSGVHGKGVPFVG